MKQFIVVSLAFLTLILGMSFVFVAEKKQVNFMIQMKNYSGEGAYVIVSLINPEGDYEKTLKVFGDDDEWYHELTSWWKFQGRKRNNIDGITGSTISGGERNVNTLSISEDKIGKGYKLRFETAVENENYFTQDVEFELNEKNLKMKHAGKGFIRFIRFLPS